jgi:hypothetical protein
MNQSERFRAIFNFEKADRTPILFFGTWFSTKIRWKAEGLEYSGELNTDPGPQMPGMDPDWEDGIWNCHGIVNVNAIGNIKEEILSESDKYIVRRTSLGAVVKDHKLGLSMSYDFEHALKPDRDSWNQFKKFLDPHDPLRFPENWVEKAEAFNQCDRVKAFVGGSLYGWLRGWMGLENISYLMYDDPELFEEMVAYLTDYFIEVFTPVVKKVKFDFVYIFEDCCGSNGPLFSPTLYKNVLDKYYKKLLKFYKENSVSLALIDSDGLSEKLIPLWLESGFDIIFPIEVGKWKASPVELRKKYGKDLKMMGGVDKNVIPLGEEAIREHLEGLKSAVDEGGYLPIPDHRIAPECSYNQFLTYIRVFNEVFNNAKNKR